MRPNRRKPLEVYWLQPALMVLYLVLGVLTAITHHLYYFSLHHGRVYMGSRQQWPIRIGSALTFLSTAFFNMAIVAAYTQYLWTKLRNKTFSLLGIDRLFALTSDATGLCSQEVVRRAKLLALLALFTWLLPFTTPFPPATLAVANIIVPFVIQTAVPTLETNINKGWSTDMYAIDHLQGSSRTRHWAPTVWVRQIAVQTAINAAIGAIPAPAPNSSYSLTIPGPALACNYASEDQQRKFEEHHYKHSVTWSTGPEQRQYERSLLVYNAFEPDDNATKASWPNLQFWVQTAEHSIVCVQGFAYFTANFSWTSGSPNHQVTRLNFTSDTSGETGWKDRASSTVFAGLSDVILGNLSIDTEDHLRLKSKGNIMITGLRGCDEIARNYWLNKTIPDPPKLIAPFLMGNPGMSASFPSNPWLCRNKTLPLALEDLSNNVTMSLLGSELTQNETVTTVQFSPSELVYEYDPVNLILTYSIVGLISLLAVMFGLAALEENGIAHSRTFSAIMDATRSPELAKVTKDCGLGMMPLDKQAEKTKLRFGVLKGVKEGDSHRVGFRLAEEDPEEEQGSNGRS